MFKLKFPGSGYYKATPRSQIHSAPRGAILSFCSDTWPGIQLNRMAELTTLAVRTVNSLYEITILDGSAKAMCWICPGMRLEFVRNRWKSSPGPTHYPSIIEVCFMFQALHCVQGAPAPAGETTSCRPERPATVRPSCERCRMPTRTRAIPCWRLESPPPLTGSSHPMLWAFLYSAQWSFR